MPRGHKKDPLSTLTRCYLDPRSFITRSGEEILYGEDMSVRRHDVYLRSDGFCEECGKPIDELLPSEHPKSCHVHHVKERGNFGSDNMDNLVACCKRCHDRHHAKRNPQFRTSRA